MKKALVILYVFAIIVCPLFGCQNAEKTAAIDAFNTAIAGLEAKNQLLNNEISLAEAVFNDNKPVFDNELYTKLEAAISLAKTKMVVAPKQPKDTEEILSLVETLNATDYSAIIKNLTDSRISVEKENQRYELVDAPAESYIIESLAKVPKIIDIVAATEETDPMNNLNKDGWYTSFVVFSCTMVNQAEVVGDTLIEKGTDAGGGIEVYRTHEEAVKRDEYLSNFNAYRYRLLCCSNIR